METIYLDTLICVNLFIDYIILSTTKLLLHINTKNRRILLASIFASLTTLWVLVPNESIFLSALYKIFTTIGIVLLAFGKTTFRKTFIRCLLFLGISMIISVFIMSINLMYKPTGVFIYNDNVYFDISPETLVIATAIAYLFINIYQKLISNQKLATKIHTITISIHKDTNITFESALDTCCNLKEPFSGLPVILTEKDILKDINIEETKLRVVPYSTIAGSDVLYAFKPEDIEIDGKKIKDGCYVGICENKLKGEVKSIMGPQITEAL